MADTHRAYVPAANHDWLLPLYDPMQKWLLGGFVYRALVEQARLQAGQRVLEIGCGTGNVLMLITQLAPQVEAVGLDPDPKALARARRKIERARVSVRLYRGFADALPYGDASFERVFSSFMFHHLTLDVKTGALREAHRVLKPGGSLELLDFGGAHVPASGWLARVFHGADHFRDNTGDRIPTLMREAGFTTAAEIADRSTLFGHVAYFRAAR